MRLTEIANSIDVEVNRDAEFVSLGFITHQTPKRLIFIENKKYLSKLKDAVGVSAVITTPDMLAYIPDVYGLMISLEPRKAFYTLHNYLAEHTNFYWLNFASRISDNAIIHPTAYIAPVNVVIEDGVNIEPHVTIYEKTTIGENSIIRSGATIGAIGFEFKRFGDKILHVIHAGGAKIGKRVEIQCNSNVDRAVFDGFTEIGDDTKIDTLVHIGHQTIVGKRCMIAASTVLCGSAIIGDDVWIGPHSIISSEISIGAGANITLGSVVTRSVAPQQRVTGNFAIDHNKFITFMKSIDK